MLGEGSATSLSPFILQPEVFFLKVINALFKLSNPGLLLLKPFIGCSNAVSHEKLNSLFLLLKLNLEALYLISKSAVLAFSLCQLVSLSQWLQAHSGVQSRLDLLQGLKAGDFRLEHRDKPVIVLCFLDQDLHLGRELSLHFANLRF